MGMLSEPKAEARRRGRHAALAWVGTGVLAFGVSSTFLGLIGGGVSAWLTWRWLTFRGKWGLRF